MPTRGTAGRDRASSGRAFAAIAGSARHGNALGTRPSSLASGMLPGVPHPARDHRDLPPGLTLRDGVDADGAALVQLIGGVFAEYPGCVLDLDEMPELRAIASHFAASRGRFFVVERERAGVIACVGCAPRGPDAVELKKLYVAASERRRGLGSRLCALVEAIALASAASRVELWSDTRFVDAHRLYEGRGYVRGPETRALGDRSATVEFFFAKTF